MFKVVFLTSQTKCITNNLKTLIWQKFKYKTMHLKSLKLVKLNLNIIYDINTNAGEIRLKNIRNTIVRLCRIK